MSSSLVIDGTQILVTLFGEGWAATMRRKFYSYVFLSGGRIVHQEVRRYPDDRHAIQLARALAREIHTEVWENNRLVARLNPPDDRSADQ